MSSVLLGKHHLITLNRLKKCSGKGVHPDFESAAKDILEHFQQAITFDAAWVVGFDPRSLNIVDIYLSGFCQESFSKYLDVHYSKAPVPTISQVKHEGFISKKGSDLLDDSTWTHSAFYNEIIKPLNLKFFLILAVVNDRREYHGLIVLWRSLNRSDFSSRDCFFVEKTSVHCSMLLEKIDTKKEDLHRPEVLRIISQRPRPGAMLLGEANEILYMNREAKNILYILESGKKQLYNGFDRKFWDKVHRLASGVRQKAIAAESALGGVPFDVFTFRGSTFIFRAISLEGTNITGNLVMILIEPMEAAGNPFSAKNGDDRYPNFTAREGAVARLVGRGLTNKEIASELDIGVHTVKDHVKNIMRKLKTSTRSGIASKTNSSSESILTRMSSAIR
jgi:DNA-binding CsgD family transcriptional regulator